MPSSLGCASRRASARRQGTSSTVKRDPTGLRGSSARLLARVNVGRLRYPALVHPPLLGQFARRLVPPDGPRVALLLQEVRLFLHQLADELRVLGNVVAAGEHHGAEFRSDESMR